ncbi:MAG: branched-chain amino acid ABC transporter permease, partial [Blautia sp.]|nr:branched-chain amino acid ABC transporter permease [Blautia sp.]
PGWFFGLSGRTSFFLSAAAILFVCFADKFHEGSAWIPTYAQHVLVNCLLAAILALGLNFVSGYLGQTSLGHAAFFGIGAYTTAVVLKYTPLNFWLSIPLAMAAAAIVAIPLSMASLRVKGQFLIVITYAFCEIFRYVAINTTWLGGNGGLPGLKSPEIFGVKLTKIAATNKGGYILILFLIVSALAFFSWRMERSRVGYALHAIREDEIAAKAMGINVKYYKVLAMMISAVICALGGCFQAVFSSMVSPELFSSTKSIQILTFVVIGGRRSIKGMILGGALLSIVPEFFHSVKDMMKLSFDPWMILYGVLLVVMMRVRPQGIWGAKDRGEDESLPVMAAEGQQEA